MKVWNSKNGKPLTSFELENYIIYKNYLLCCNIKDYFFYCVENISLSFSNLPEYKKTKLERLEKLVKSAKDNEINGYYCLAKSEVEKIFN